MRKWLIMLLVLVSTTTFAGNEAGNGGVSIVCRDFNERIIKSELLDLFEGRELYGLKYQNQELSVETLIELAQLKLIKYPKYLIKLQEELAKIEKRIVFIREGIELNPTNDAFPVINLKGCGYEQLANYTNQGDLFVSQEIFDSLNATNKAALYIHEAVYSLRREFGETNSRNARLLTSHLMASNPDISVIERLAKLPPWTSTPPTYNGKPICGVTGTIKQRLEECNSIYSGFALLTRTRDGNEIYKDLETGLIWSSGSHSVTDFQRAKQLCEPSRPEFAGLTQLSWRVPSDKDFMTAEESGFSFLLLKEKGFRSSYWTSVRASDGSPYGLYFDAITAKLEYGMICSGCDRRVICLAKEVKIYGE